MELIFIGSRLYTIPKLILFTFHFVNNTYQAM